MLYIQFYAGKLFFYPVAPDGLADACRRHADQQKRTAVTYKRQNQSGDGGKTDIYIYIDNNLGEKQSPYPQRRITAEFVLCVKCRRQYSQTQQQKHTQQSETTEKSPLFGYRYSTIPST